MTGGAARTAGSAATVATEGRTATVAYRVRFDECGPDGLARTSALLRYAQDVAWIHSERLGFDREWYRSRALTWLVRTARVVVLRPIPLGTTLDVSTTVVGFRRVWARRLTEGRLADGTLAFWAHTDWVIVDGRGQPTRIPAEFPATFGAPPGPFEPGRVPLPDTPRRAATHLGVVRQQDLDPMGHVNNAAYLDYLEEALLAANREAAAAVVAVPRTIRIEYLVPAAPRTVVRGRTWPRPDAGDGAADEGPAWAWRLTDEAGTDLARGMLAAAGSEAGEAGRST